MATTTATNNFVMRLIGAAALDTAIYEEVEADRTATGQALLVSSCCRAWPPASGRAASAAGRFKTWSSSASSR